ncbi:MAG: rRNA pseudouridine synthase [Syntrophomonadaceae bacterium]|nr:rRNA pseudouridine synthase [Syntrophomonadaceae bacterium]
MPNNNRFRLLLPYREGLEIRLARALAAAGVASRRKAAELIAQGLVIVNGQVVTELGTNVDPDSDVISVRGIPVKGESKVYIMLNKPPGVISSVVDYRGRKTVIDPMTGLQERVFPVGRLDYDSRGLLLLTNDGEFANLMTHPSYQIPKVYEVWCKGRIVDDAIMRLEKGIILDEEVTAPARVRILRQTPWESLVSIQIREGRKRQIKRMMEAVGFPVSELKRVKLGSLELKGLGEGNYRYLTDHEVEALIKQARKRTP